MTQKIKQVEKQAQYQKQLYGLYVIIHPSSDPASVEKLHAELCEIVKQQGEIQESKECTKQELSFPIQKSVFAHTTTIYFTTDPEHIAEVRKAIKMVDGPLIRYMLTKESHIPSAESEIILPETPEGPNPREDAPQSATQQEKPAPSRGEDKSKITLEDIDKKLDEIMGNV